MLLWRCPPTKGDYTPNLKKIGKAFPKVWVSKLSSFFFSFLRTWKNYFDLQTHTPIQLLQELHITYPNDYKNYCNIPYSYKLYPSNYNNKVFKEGKLVSPPCKAQYLKIVLALLVQSDTDNCWNRFLLASLVELPLLAVVWSVMILINFKA